MDEAALGFAFLLTEQGNRIEMKQITSSRQAGVLAAQWEGLKLSLPTRPTKQPKNR